MKTTIEMNDGRPLGAVIVDLETAVKDHLKSEHPTLAELTKGNVLFDKEQADKLIKEQVEQAITDCDIDSQVERAVEDQDIERQVADAVKSATADGAWAEEDHEHDEINDLESEVRDINGRLETMEESKCEVVDLEDFQSHAKKVEERLAELEGKIENDGVTGELKSKIETLVSDAIDEADIEAKVEDEVESSVESAVASEMENLDIEDKVREAVKDALDDDETDERLTAMEDASKKSLDRLDKLEEGRTLMNEHVMSWTDRIAKLESAQGQTDALTCGMHDEKCVLANRVSTMEREVTRLTQAVDESSVHQELTNLADRLERLEKPLQHPVKIGEKKLESGSRVDCHHSMGESKAAYSVTLTSAEQAQLTTRGLSLKAAWMLVGKHVAAADTVEATLPNGDAIVVERKGTYWGNVLAIVSREA